MLAKPSDGLPTGDGWLFEPKWDGFRAMVFRDGDEIFTQSRDLKPLDRYFPELAEPLKANLPERCVLDGEIVISRDGALQFELLLLRIHPAASRVKMLAEESPASFVAWDLLALGDEDLRETPQGERRTRLEAVLGLGATAGPPDPGHVRPRHRRRLVRPVRGRGTRRGRRQAARRPVPARQAGDAQDQAPADGRLRGRRVPLAQERTGDPHRVAAAGAVRRRRHAAPRRRHVVVHLGQARGADGRAGTASRSTRWRATPGRTGPSGPATGRPTRPASGCRARPRAGTAARTSRGSRSASSVWPRSPMTTSRATGSGTGRRSSAGGRTRRRPTADTTSSRRRPLSRSRGSSAREGGDGHRGRRGDRLRGGPGRRLLPRRARADRRAGRPALEPAADPGRGGAGGVAASGAHRSRRPSRRSPASRRARCGRPRPRPAGVRRASRSGRGSGSRPSGGSRSGSRSGPDIGRLARSRSWSAWRHSATSRSRSRRTSA